jgi:hypothetical protein
MLTCSFPEAEMRSGLLIGAALALAATGAASAQTCPAAARRQLVDAAQDWQSAALTAQDGERTVTVLNVTAAGGTLACAGATVAGSGCSVSGPSVVEVKAPRQTLYFRIPPERHARITSGVPGQDPIRCELTSEDGSGPAAR